MKFLEDARSFPFGGAGVRFWVSGNIWLPREIPDSAIDLYLVWFHWLSSCEKSSGVGIVASLSWCKAPAEFDCRWQFGYL